MFQGSLFGPTIRAGIYRQASRVYGSGSVRPFHAFPRIPQNAGLVNNSKLETNFDTSIFRNLAMKLGFIRVADNISLPSALSFRSYIHSGEPRAVEEGRTSAPMDPLRGLHGETGNDSNGQPPSYQPHAEAGRTPRSMNYFREIRQGLVNGQGLVNDASGRPPLFGDPGRSRRPIDPVQGLHNERRNDVNGRPPLYSESRMTPRSMDYVQELLNEERGRLQGGEAGRTLRPMDHVQGLIHERGLPLSGRAHPYQVESNADIVHIKLTRNNSYVTLTDSKGNKKAGVSAAMAAGKGEKPARYSAEAAAENIGRRAREMRVRSVVVKVSGCTFFKKKKDAILAFKDGYSSSRGDLNPVVYVEDTTRKPHNGCRLPKKRRI